MKIEDIKISPQFGKHYQKLPKRIKKIAKEKEKIFRENSFDSRLGTHKLKGEQKETWAFLITYSYRIKFLFLSSGEVLFLDVGTHDIYK